MTKRHIPMMVDPEFEELVKRIQVNIRMQKGENVSLREITRRISNLPELNQIEEKILGPQFDTINPNQKLNRFGKTNTFIKFDKRKGV